MFDGSLIRQHMEVVGSDGRHVGTVDRIEGRRIKLTNPTPQRAGNTITSVSQSWSGSPPTPFA